MNFEIRQGTINAELDLCVNASEKAEAEAVLSEAFGADYSGAMTIEGWAARWPCDRQMANDATVLLQELGHTVTDAS